MTQRSNIGNFFDCFYFYFARGLSEDVQMAEILIHQTISQQPRLETLTMTVPSGCCGRIIGRQGDTIK